MFPIFVDEFVLLIFGKLSFVAAVLFNIFDDNDLAFYADVLRVCKRTTNIKSFGCKELVTLLQKRVYAIVCVGYLLSFDEDFVVDDFDGKHYFFLIFF